MVYDYLIFDDNVQITRDYKDLDDDENEIANAVFDENTTWKDQF
jgi:hypothetical protein